MRVLPLLLLASCAASSAHHDHHHRHHAADHDTPEIPPAWIESHVRFLADDLLEGRGVATRGDALARLYIRTQLEAAGLQPGGPEGSWEQPVPILGLTAEVTEPLRATNGTETLAFEPVTDFTAVAARPAAETSFDEAEVVFVGYGIDAPEQQWDDFKGMDLKGKVLLVMNSDPASDPNLFGGKARLYYGRWTYKYEEAARRGAVGAIILHTNESAAYPWQVVQSNHGRENFWLPFAPDSPTIAIRSWVTEEAGSRLCKLGGHDLAALRTSAESRDFKPVPLGVKVSLRTRNTVRELQSANVLGMLPGSDPELAKEVVVITSHFDHLGIGTGRNGDRIHNGAVDNASGIAGMLAMARALKDMPRPRRSLLFAAVTAEESGLLGSSWYTRHPTVPQQQIVANFNVDGLNVWGATEDIEFVGHGKSDLTAVAEGVARDFGRRLTPDSSPDAGVFYRSDHFPFARIGVPAAYFKAGSSFLDRPEDRKRMKASFTTIHYHQPSDELAPWWNFASAAADTRLILACLVATANRDQAPRWTPGDEFEKFR